MSVRPSTAALVALGEKVQLTAEVRDQNGQAMTGAAVTWSSGTIRVATVDTAGLVTAVGNGIATITAAAGAASATATVTVEQTVVDVRVLPDSVTFGAVGDTARLVAEALDSNGQAVPGAQPFDWSSDEDVVTVDTTGLLTAVANGTATARATSGGASDSATVVVKQEVSAVRVSPIADTLVVGDTLRLAGEALDANQNRIEGARFTWSSSDTLVARVDDSGLVTAVAIGASTVTASSSEVMGGAEVTVVAPAPTTVRVRPDTVFSAVGETSQLAVEVRDQAGRVLEDAAVSWSSDAPTVAIVNSAGLVTAVAAGRARVTATAGPASGAVIVIVQSVSSVVVSPTAGTVAVGDTLRLLAETYDTQGVRISDAPLEWTSSAVSIASVDSGGLVTALAEGRVTIRATAGNRWGTSEITVSTADRAALVALYEATGGPGWTNQGGWLTDGPLEEWYGVDTDDSGRVVSLQLSGNTLSGRIPPAVGNLAGLRDLWLHHNILLSGAIPPELGNLAHLTRLSLSENNHSGPIPSELGSLTSLRELSLGRNNLSGPIPPELGDLINLQDLRLHQNRLSGSIPPELGRLSSLRSLSLSNNDLSGPIPPELGHLASLQWLALIGNQLTGPIPPELGSLRHLRELGLTSNNLSGLIPRQFGDLASLESLGLGWNKLSGAIPTELGRLDSLTVLSLRNNDLSGPIPLSLMQLGKLRVLRLSENESLCVPGTAVFAAWIHGLESAEQVRLCNDVDRRVLSALHKTSDGPNWIDDDGWLTNAALENWHGVIADSLGRVTELDLAYNGLAGRLPANLGDLTRMTVLRIGGNALWGRLPLGLVGLPLREFWYRDTELCAPRDAAFQAWLAGIRAHESTGLQCEPLSDRAVLVALYETTGGSNWTRSDNWLSVAPLDEWHGVAADDGGRVTGLTLRNNGLTGSIPPEIGKLASLTRLDVQSNALTGAIPPELGSLASLTGLYLSGNDLTGSIPPDLGNLASLTRLEAQSNALSGTIPPDLGNLASLTGLYLHYNDLTGSIPPDLGNLTRLQDLRLSNNDLIGLIPPDLGDLVRLRSLGLGNNRLSGGIPPQLGNLTGLQDLYLANNDLSGSVPTELGNLIRLQSLLLSDNELSGSVPQELGDLDGLQSLDLGRNRLSGDIPREFGSLASLRWLRLADNELSGPVPPELGGLSSLEELEVTNNVGLAGALPVDLTALPLKAFLAGGTDLCVPPISDFRPWLARMRKRRVATCVATPAYVTQAVQSREFPVPLVAGEKALLRVFPTAPEGTRVGVPPMRARFYLDGQEAYVVDTPGKPGPVPPAVDESDLSRSANAEVPAWVVRPGLEMAIEIDPEGTLAPVLGVGGRIPETGRVGVEVREMPPFNLTVIPFLWLTEPDSAVLGIVAGMVEDPDGHELLEDTRTLLPVGDLAVMAHEPVLTSTNNMFSLLNETAAIRTMEGSSGYYMGMMTPQGMSGVARLGGWSSFVRPDPLVIAHELGHNLGLLHAPCGSSSHVDASFPHRGGRIGAWGYDSREGGRLGHPATPDLMSYCRPQWISDYHFTNALRFRLSGHDRAELSRAAPTTSLLLWGGAGPDGALFLNPAFVADASPALPDSAGDHGIAGRTAEGTILFSFSFPMSVVADGDGSSSFAFLLPIQSGWANELESITLSGPTGTVTLDGETDRPTAILRNPRTGQVRGILRDLVLPPTQAAADAGGSSAAGFEVIFSRGIPDIAGSGR